MIQIIILFLVLSLVLPVLWGFIQALGPELNRKLRRFALWTGLFLLIAMAATGRLGWILPLAGALLAAVLRWLPGLIPLLPVLKRLWRKKRPENIRDESIVETRFLRMALDRGTGEIRGEVLAGSFGGRQLWDLSLSDLQDLHSEFMRADPESARLLRAYLDRVHGDRWRGETEYDEAAGRTGASGKMNRTEALAILGLSEGATRQVIVEAHRRLMQKLHPDRGGSNYLAAKINQAKDVLLHGS